MRIIAGEFGGRVLRPPGDRRVRPTADRVREAWMSKVAPLLVEARVLDLFAGSGALGLEALSRGADHVTFVELGRQSLEALRRNIAALDVEQRVTVHRGDAVRYAARLGRRAFDVAFADPPYGSGQAEHLATIFREREFAGTLGIEHARTTTLPGDESRSYGNVALTFFHAS